MPVGGVPVSSPRSRVQKLVHIIIRIEFVQVHRRALGLRHGVLAPQAISQPIIPVLDPRGVGRRVIIIPEVIDHVMEIGANKRACPPSVNS